MDKWQSGFNVIVLVILFSNLVQGLTYPLKLLKHAFGEKAVKKHGVCLVTGADEFRKRMKSQGAEDKEFTEWCNEQQGGIRSFLDEFETLNRLVLFDIGNEHVKRQVSQLLNSVESLPQPNSRYTYKNYIEDNSKRSEVIADEEFDILLVGGDGNGKRETVKSIESVSINVDRKSILGDLVMTTCQRTDAKLRLYHGINVVDTKDNDDDNEDKASTEARFIMDNLQSGFNAIVLVIYFSNLIMGLLQPLSLLKFAFGLDAVKKHGICIVTGADEFRKRMRSLYGTEDKLFYDWCTEQVGKIRDFLDSFQLDRVVLFDMDNDAVKERQVLQFLQCVRKLPNPEKKFSRQSFSDSCNTLPRKPSKRRPVITGMHRFLVSGITEEDKNSTANAILDWPAFSSIGGAAVKKVESMWADKGTYEVKVISAPLVTSLDPIITKNNEPILVEMDFHYEKGYDALLFIFRHNHNFQEGELVKIRELDKLLGEGTIHSHGICIVLVGEDFESTIETFCSNAHGRMKLVLDMFSMRAVLFDNITKNVLQQSEQLQDLMECMNRIVRLPKIPKTSKALIKLKKDLKKHPLSQEEVRRLCSLIYQS